MPTPRPPAGSLSARDLPQLRDGRSARALGVCLAGRFRIGQAFHVLAGRVVRAAEGRTSRRFAKSRLEQSFRQRRRAQHADGDAAGRFAENRHLLRIAAERGDILLHPLEPRDHVQQAVIARDVVRGLGAQLRVREETQLPDAVGDADQHHALPGQLLPAVVRFGSGAGAESAAVDPNQHGDVVARGFRRRPDVQVQAVLARVHARAASAALHAPGAELGGLPHALPFRGGLRRAPAEVADRRRGERDAPVDRQPVFGGPLHQSALDLHGRGCLRDANPAGEYREKNETASFKTAFLPWQKPLWAPSLSRRAAS